MASASSAILPKALCRIVAVSALLLVAVATASAARTGGLVARASLSSVPLLPPLEAKRLMDEEGYGFLDVRTEEEFAQVHVPGSDLIPYLITAPDGTRQPNLHFIEQVKTKYALDTRLIVACRHGTPGQRSYSAAREMAAQGYTRLVNLQGGIAAWEEAGLPLVRGDGEQGLSVMGTTGKLASAAVTAVQHPNRVAA